MTLIHLAYLTFLFTIAHGDECKLLDPCRCRLTNGSEINLHRIKENGFPEFGQVWKVDNRTYKYSPCRGMTCGGDVKNASVCSDDALHKSPKLLGNITMSVFEVDNIKDNWRIRYLTKDASNTNSIVHLTCATMTKFELTKYVKYNQTTYQFLLYSPCACPDGCLPATSSISTGTILLLIFFSLVLLYFGVGSLYKKSVFRAEGREVIPHTDFWCSLPGYIKDGYLFFISPCLGQTVEYRSYDKL